MNGLRVLFLVTALFVAARMGVATVRHCRAQHVDFSSYAIADYTDPMNIVDEAMQPIRQMLKGQPTVAYFSSHPPNTDPSGIRGWVGVQYALAPTIVQPEGSSSWVLAYFDTSNELTQFLKKRRYQFRAESPVGVRLYLAYGERP